jgi:hypothetical protein
MTRLAGVALLIVALMCAAGRSAAQATPDADLGEKAVVLGREGLKLFEQGAFEEARARFSAADALSRSPVFRLYIARCLRHTGRLLAARDAYAAIRSEDAGPNDPSPWKQAKADAAGELAALTAIVPAIRISVKSAKDRTAVTLDEKPVELDTRIEVDPGDHVVVATAGEHARTERFTIAEGAAELAITIDMKAPEPSATIAPPATPPAKEAPRAADAATAASVYAGATLIGVGAASLIAGAVTGALTLMRSEEIEEICGDGGTCPRSRRGEVEPLVDEATALGHASTGTLVAGGVLAATGLVLVLVRPGEEPSTARSGVRLDPTFGGMWISADF